MSEQTMSEQTMSEQTMSEQTMSEQNRPCQNRTDHVRTEQTMLEQTMSEQTTLQWNKSWTWSSYSGQVAGASDSRLREPGCCHFKLWAFTSFTLHCSSSLSYTNEYLVVDSVGCSCTNNCLALTHFILKLVQTSCCQFLIISSNQSVSIKQWQAFI